MLPFKLWIDADALPRILRDVIMRASDRYQLEVTFVANQNVGITPSVRINSIQVMGGADQADQEIVNRMQNNDIVVTQDIPLAAQVIEKGVSLFTLVERFSLQLILKRGCIYGTLWIPCAELGFRQVAHHLFQTEINVSLPVAWIRPY